MFNRIFTQLNNIAHSPWYWRIYIITGLALLAAALFYHHVLGELPCLLCIQVRLFLSLLVIVAIVGLVSMRHTLFNLMVHIATVLIAVRVTDISYQLLGTERGFVFSDCGFNLGLPAWFAIDEWLPWLYRVETTCGYTPEIIFGITMAEALMVMSVLFLLTSIAVTLVSIYKIIKQD